MGKKLTAIKKDLDQSKEYSLKEAISIVKKSSFTKFDETLEIAINLGVDPRHSDQMVRGMVSLPAGTGKDVRVAVICKDDKIAEATTAGADLAGSVAIIDDIKAGKIDFDVCIATPDMMGMVGQIARVLGPKGLMPNPKLGTVTADITTAVKNAKSGQVEYRVEKAGIIHAGVGKVSFSETDLQKNAQTLIDSVLKSKPAGVKGAYLRKIHVSSTMGPSLKVDISTISQQR
ncbi:MAG: 50S ribosomal protein L1 [Rickettsiaceae bacterium]|nr:50S ribosomal protein L1 [Rickettsiaceae bacterium]